MSVEPNWEEVNKDKEAKKQAVIDHIASKCTAESEIDDLRAIGACLSSGSKLDITILTGGLANYTYRISCKDSATGLEHKLFAKLSFPYAMLFPDKPCPLSRTENEFKMMNTFHNLSPGLVATPYFCDDIGEDMKLLVTQWSKVDEQFANQFIDGTTDIRTADKLAGGIAALHSSTNFDKKFNADMRPWMHSLTPIIKEIVGGLHKPDNADRVAVLAKEIGEDTTSEMINSYIKSVDDMDCLIHGDLHTFNILTGSKPSVASLENFERTGSVVVCDWEMSHVGCAGHDIGPLRSFPISCAFAHSINGHAQAGSNCIEWLDTFWSSYEESIRKSGASDEEVTKVFRQSLQYSALYSLAYYGIDVHMDFLPIDEGNKDDLKKVQESTGVFGLKCLQWGMDTSLSLEVLKENYKRAIEQEMTRLLKVKKVRRGRRSSMLRAAGRRVSDANLHYALDRMSISSSVENRRGSMALIHKLESISRFDNLSCPSVSTSAQ